MSETRATIPFELRRLEKADWAAYRDLRLEALKNHPEAFASSWERETGEPETWWAERLENSFVSGGWLNDKGLAGMAGLYVEGAAKLQHKGILWGMYVRPEARGAGMAAALVQSVVNHARTRVEQICLSVVAANIAARRLYREAGFEEYGLEPRALKVGDEYHDEVLMILRLNLRPDPGTP